MTFTTFLANQSVVTGFVFLKPGQLFTIDRELLPEEINRLSELLNKELEGSSNKPEALMKVLRQMFAKNSSKSLT